MAIQKFINVSIMQSDRLSDPSRGARERRVTSAARRAEALPDYPLASRTLPGSPRPAPGPAPKPGGHFKAPADRSVSNAGLSPRPDQRRGNSTGPLEPKKQPLLDHEDSLREKLQCAKQWFRVVKRDPNDLSIYYGKFLVDYLDNRSRVIGARQVKWARKNMLKVRAGQRRRHHARKDVINARRRELWAIAKMLNQSKSEIITYR